LPWKFRGVALFLNYNFRAKMPQLITNSGAYLWQKQFQKIHFQQQL